MTTILSVFGTHPEAFKMAPVVKAIDQSPSLQGRVCVTGNRRESFGEGFESIYQALADIARKNPDVQILYPVHLNPNV